MRVVDWLLEYFNLAFSIQLGKLMAMWKRQRIVQPLIKLPVQSFLFTLLIVERP